MVSGPELNRLLVTLSSMTQSGRILEIGTFTGYATLSFCKGAAKNKRGEVGGREGGPCVLSLERDSRAFEIAAAHLEIASKYSKDGGDEDWWEQASGEARRLSLKNDDHDDGIVICTRTETNAVFSFQNITGLCELVKVNDNLATVEKIVSTSIIRNTATDDTSILPRRIRGTLRLI